MDTTDSLSRPLDLEGAGGPSRRGFLRIAALSGTGLVAAGLAACTRRGAPSSTYGSPPAPNANPGAWAFHCHILPDAEGRDGMFGMVTALVVQP